MASITGKPERARIIGAMKASHAAYLASIAGSRHEQTLEARLRILRRRLQDLLRKEEGSANSMKGIPNLARLLFGMHENLRSFGLPPYTFEPEKEVVNRLIAAAPVRRATGYFGACGSYGETLLNCYLDLFITLTVLKTPREIEAKPGFLVNPVTGSLLEIDVLLEDFCLGFEFQGEHHYVDPKTMAKDAFKLRAFGQHDRVLIPVNIAQLQGAGLQTLIVNSIKDYLGLHELLAGRDASKFRPGSASDNQLMRFSKATQRIYLSEVLFAEALDWLDAEAKRYVANMSARNLVSGSTPAPRQVQPTGDLTVAYVYQNLKYVTQARRR